MQVTEKSAEGLTRTFEVVVPAADLAAKLEAKIEEIRPQVRLKGFRPGKVPASHIRKVFGPSMMGEIVEDAVKETSQKALAERELRAATFPQIELNSSADDVAKGGADLAYELRVELMPEFDPLDPKTLKLKRPVAEVEDGDVDEALTKLADDHKVYEARRKGSKAKDGDQVVIDFLGKKDGEPFDGGAAEGAEIVIGAGRFIPGFEEGVEGMKVDEEKVLELTFPDDYPAPELAGAEVTFDVTVNEIRAPKDAEVDDALAKQLGFDDLEALKEAVKANLGREFEGQTRLRLKRRILDAIDEAHDFALPEKMVEAEFGQIWQHVERDIEAGTLDDEDKDKPVDELKTDYRKIAERRVRLGLVLAEIGRENEVEVTSEELARAVNNEARRHPGQEREVVEFFQSNEAARNQLRAPIYEEKVVEHIIEVAKITDEKMDREALFAAED